MGRWPAAFRATGGVSLPASDGLLLSLLEAAVHWDQGCLTLMAVFWGPCLSPAKEATELSCASCSRCRETRAVARAWAHNQISFVSSHQGNHM